MKKPTNGKATLAQTRKAARMLAAMPQGARAAARRLADRHGTTPVEEVARVSASMKRVCRRGDAERDIGVPKATAGELREALRREAKRRGCSICEVLRQEKAAHRRACGRGKLYRADIMGEDFMQTRATEVAEAAKQGRAVPMPLRPGQALRMARRAAAEREDHALDMASMEQTIGAELAHTRERLREAEAQCYRLMKRIEADGMQGAEWLTIGEVAQRLQCSVRTVRRRFKAMEPLKPAMRKGNGDGNVPPAKQARVLYKFPLDFK